jgi:hypothetical protein
MSRASRTPPPYTHADFERLALEAFPVLRAEFDDAEGLLHLQMHAFQRLTERAAKAGDWDTFRRCVDLATELWQRPEPELYNALNVSFLEHLDFEGPHGAEAWMRLTSDLKRGWEAMERYNKELRAAERSPETEHR